LSFEVGVVVFRAIISRRAAPASIDMFHIGSCALHVEPADRFAAVLNEHAPVAARHANAADDAQNSIFPR